MIPYYPICFVVAAASPFAIWIVEKFVKNKKMYDMSKLIYVCFSTRSIRFLVKCFAYEQLNTLRIVLCRESIWIFGMLHGGMAEAKEMIRDSTTVAAASSIISTHPLSSLRTMKKFFSPEFLYSRLERISVSHCYFFWRLTSLALSTTRMTNGLLYLFFVCAAALPIALSVCCLPSAHPFMLFWTHCSRENEHI